MKKLNLGCASQVVDGWINVDYFLGARLAKLPLFTFLNSKLKIFKMNWSKDIFLHDLTRPLPWNSNAVDEIYTSHTLEHLSREDGLSLIAECYRVLKCGGVLRIVVPDLQVIVGKYNSGSIKSDEFIEALGATQHKPKGLRGIIKKLTQYPHQCMYTTERLKEIMESNGLDTTPKKFGESLIADIEKIELEGRTKSAVVLEGIKK